MESSGKRTSTKWPGQKEFNQAQLLEFIHQDYVQARRYYEKACKVGHPMAQYQYGLWFLDDGKTDRVKPDEVKARKLFEGAAGRGIGVAQIALGQMYEAGKAGLKKDETKAFELYKEALRNPSTIPKENLGKICNKIGLMYMEGKGTLKDVNKALKWFKRAEGDSSLPQNLQVVLEMLAQMNPGIPQQKEADKKWSVLCDYIDKLPQEEKPKTFKSWVAVMRKCGYEVHSEYLEKTDDDTPCNFPEFMELCGGSFGNLESYELEDYPAPKRKCGFCEKEEGDDVTLKSCSRCAQPYCSKSCQKKDWPIHKPTCNAVYDHI